MKKNNIYLMGLSAIFMLTSFVRPASAVGEMEMKASSEPEMRKELSNPGVAGINVIVYDGTDRIVYNDRIPAGSNFEDQFDFSGVEEGTYRLVKQLDDINFIRNIKVQENGVVISESLYSFTPRFEQDEKLLSVKFMNLPETQVRVKITDSWETIFEDSYQETASNYTRNYDLQSFPRGTYTFQLMSDQEEFSYKFEVE